MFALEGTGSYLPANTRGCSDLERDHGLSAGRLSRAPGVSFRHIVSDQDQIDLAQEAATRALGDAGMSVTDLDLVVCANAVPYQPIPSTSGILAARLGIEDGSIETFDLNTTCLSFLSAFDKVAALIAAGIYGRALIVSSEIASRGLPWKGDPETAALFGDGASAAIMGQGESRVVARRFLTYPSGWTYCQLASGGTRLQLNTKRDAFQAGSELAMQGRDLYRATRKFFPDFVRRLLDDAGWRHGDIDVVIPHQASPQAIEHMKRACNFTDDQVITTIQDTSNMIAASIPHALDQAKKTGRVGTGDRALLLGTSAGLALGGLALEIAK